MAGKKSHRPKKVRNRRPAPARPLAAPVESFVVRPPRTRYGPRTGGKIKYAQFAILGLYGGIPRDASPTRLAREISDWLARHSDPSCRAIGHIDPDTVRRALKVLLEANK